MVGDLVAIVSSVYEEEPEYLKYVERISREDLAKFAPDLASGRKVTRCIVLCKLNLDEVRKPPRIGESVRIMDDFEIRNMHFARGEFMIPYLIPLIRKTKNVELVRSVITKLMKLIPEELDLLEILLSEIEYSRMRGVSIG